MSPDNKNTPAPINPQDMVAGGKANFEYFNYLANNYDEWGINRLLVSFVSLYDRLSTKRIDQLRSKLSQHPLIDIGGHYGTNRFVTKFRLPQYINVDLATKDSSNGNIVNVNSEVLEYLLQCSDSSANIMSNGYLCSDLSGTSDYSRTVLQEAARVIPVGGVLVTAHFDLEKILPPNLVAWKSWSNEKLPVKVFEKVS
jgi:hypothetical protein